MTTHLMEVPAREMVSDRKGMEGVGHGLAAGDVGGRVLEQVAHPDGRDHYAHPGSGAQGLIGCPLDTEAQGHRQRQNQQQADGDDGGGGR